MTIGIRLVCWVRRKKTALVSRLSIWQPIDIAGVANDTRPQTGAQHNAWQVKQNGVGASEKIDSLLGLLWLDASTLLMIFFNNKKKNYKMARKNQNRKINLPLSRPSSSSVKEKRHGESTSHLPCHMQPKHSRLHQQRSVSYERP